MNALFELYMTKKSNRSETPVYIKCFEVMLCYINQLLLWGPAADYTSCCINARCCRPTSRFYHQRCLLKIQMKLSFFWHCVLNKWLGYPFFCARRFDMRSGGSDVPRQSHASCLQWVQITLCSLVVSMVSVSGCQNIAELQTIVTLL